MSTESARLLRVLRAAYLALVVAVGVYGVMAVIITGRPRPGGPMGAPPPDVSTWIPWFAGAAVVLAIVAPLIRRRLLRPLPGGPRGAEISNADAFAATGRLLTAYLTTWAMCEALALLGFVLALVGDRALYFAPFAAASLVGFALYVPRARQVQVEVKRLLSGAG